MNDNETQRIIREMAGLLSTFGHHATKHPEECIPEAEAIYDAHFAQEIANAKNQGQVRDVREVEQSDRMVYELRLLQEQVKTLTSENERLKGLINESRP